MWLASSGPACTYHITHFEDARMRLLRACSGIGLKNSCVLMEQEPLAALSTDAATFFFSKSVMVVGDPTNTFFQNSSTVAPLVPEVVGSDSD